MKRIHPENPAEWRAWLEEHHATEEGVALIHDKKHTGRRAMSAQEAMDEAICYGWIDTTIKRLDEDHYLQHFRRRTKNSRWSENTLKYARRLIKDGKMAPAGKAAYEHGLTRPVLERFPKNPDVPAELAAALKKRPALKRKFEALAPSRRRLHIIMVARAVKPETKRKRVAAVLAAL